ncbi:DUF2304 domain-containing protein [Flexivirga lutea]
MIFQTFAIVVALATIAGMYALIRQGWLKEKYTLIWVLAALVTFLVGVFPPILDWFADIVGVQQGPNLLFLAAGVAMMLICVQLSVEASTQSYKSRTLAEEIAILRLEVERQRRDLDALTALTVEHRLERGLHQ